MRSMFVKLTLAFVAVALVAVGLVAYLANTTTTNEFGTYYQHMSAPGGNPPAQGRGMMGGGMMNGPAMRSMMENLGAPERDFLDSVNRSMWIAGSSAVVLALLLSLALARQMSQPLRRLTFAAKSIASGDLSQRVRVNSRDELGELGNAFNSMAESLARNEQVRRNMVADIAHELRTPLTIVQGNLEAILDGIVPPTKENVASIHEETTVLARLITDLRELSLAEAGQLKLQRAPTDVAELVRKVVARNQAEAIEKGIDLDLDLPEGLPLADVDEQRVSQVVNNLLSNALRHTGSGGRVSVAARNDGVSALDTPAKDVPFLTLSVADTGSGIPAEELPYVFDRFYRLDKSRARASGGSGIGLAIVKQLVEAHGGNAWAESEVGAGSTFYFTVPAATGFHHEDTETRRGKTSMPLR
ncbi:MAG: ATP-binding protein [Dehalococcoidales bacterium]|nr:ATP-binding protein [Dehalococcoidales bacterium]